MAQDPKSENEHRKRIEESVKKIDNLYYSTVNRLVGIAATINIVDTTKIFSFNDYPSIKALVNKIILQYFQNVKSIIERGSTDEWFKASQKNDTKLSNLSKYNSRNSEALKEFLKRVEGGLDLSSRVWNLTEQFKAEIELSISAALSDGTPAKSLATSIKKYLKEPDKLFRRVRDVYGVLQLSKKAKQYKAGQGVYRSSYKNALRLTRTEINMAYRTSDHIRWKNDPSVVGFEIKLSNRHKVRDICDDLKGKYPKTFLFKGWHPQCLCYKTPILMNDSDFEKLQQSILDDEPLPKSFKAKNEVKEVPKDFKKWVNDNKERSKNWKNQPYFVKDNFTNGKLDGDLKPN